MYLNFNGRMVHSSAGNSIFPNIPKGMSERKEVPWSECLDRPALYRYCSTPMLSSHCRWRCLTRLDVVVHAEEIGWVVFVFQGDQAIVIDNPSRYCYFASCAKQGAPRPRKGTIPPEFLRILSISLSSARHSGRRAT